MRKILEKLLSAAVCLGFLLGFHDGRLALWAGDDPEPVQLFDISEQSLPPADRVLLNRGLQLETEEALWAALEDYL